MFPILKGQHSNRIGCGFDEFLEDFFDICYEHLKSKRAKAFAFILFDFEHGDVFNAVKENTVFTALDRISGQDLTVFYLDASDKRTIKKFNEIFVYALSDNKRIRLPSIVFFKIIGNDAEEIERHPLSNNKLLVFQEIHDNINSYKNKLTKTNEKRKDFLNIFGKKAVEFGASYLATKILDNLSNG